MPTNAGFVSRIVAFVIDIVVVALTIAACEWFIDTLEDLARPWEHLDISAGLVAAIPFIVGIYFVGLWRLSGQTVGKWVLGIRVVSLDGGPITLTRALLRLAGYVISAVPLYAGFVWVLFDPDRRALHDRFAGTAVVYVPRRVLHTAH